MAPAHSRLVADDEPSRSDANTAALPLRLKHPKQSKQPKPDGPLNLAKAEEGLRGSLALIPLHLFLDHWGGVIAEFVRILAQQAKNTAKTQQPLYKTVMAKLDPERKLEVPGLIEFQAFWLHAAKPLTLEQRSLLVSRGCEQLASWTGPSWKDVDFDMQWRVMADAEKNARSTLSEEQYVWRQRLLSIRVEELVCDEKGEPLLKLDFAAPKEYGAPLVQIIASKKLQWEEEIMAAQGRKDRRPSDTARPRDGVQAINASKGPGTGDLGSGQPGPPSTLLRLKTGTKPGKPEGSPDATVSKASTAIHSRVSQSVRTLRDQLKSHLDTRDKQHAAEIAKHTDRIKELEQRATALELQVGSLSLDRAERKRKAASELEKQGKAPCSGPS